MTDKFTPLQKELLDRADSIFLALKDATIAAKDFAMEQLPDIAHQLILLERVHLTIIFVLPFILATLCFIFARLSEKFDNIEPHSFKVGFFGFGAFFMGAAGVIGFIMMLFNFRDFLTVWFAPKIYLIQYISQLVKGTI